MLENENNTQTGEIVTPSGEPSKKTYKPTPKTPAQKKREKEDFKRKYFDYYDDIKTNIKQDW